MTPSAAGWWMIWSAHVAAAVVGTTALIDPERVILDGSIGRALEPWLPDIRAAVRGQGVSGARDRHLAAGPERGVTGAIARALAMVAEQDTPAQLAGRRLGQAAPRWRAALRYRAQ